MFIRKIEIKINDKSINLVCLIAYKPINVKTDEPIGPKFCVATHANQGKVFSRSKCVLKLMLTEKSAKV